MMYPSDGTVELAASSQGEELPLEEEETNKKMNINIITEEQEATTYVSPAKASRSPRTPQLGKLWKY